MTDVRKDHDGVDAPTSAAQFFDVAAVLTVLAGVLVAVLLVMGSQEGAPGWPLAVGVAVPCLLSGLLLRGAAVALRWLAAMYQLSAGEATGLPAPAANDRRTDRSAGDARAAGLATELGMSRPGGA